jgi:hypothetical protein
VALHKGFKGTGQPLPGSGGVTVWYLEDGFQTTYAQALQAAAAGTIRCTT